jgi:hypothetical protein
MANTSGRAYGLTTLCPIINGVSSNKHSFGQSSVESHDKEIRRVLQSLPLNESSLFANTDNTYLARLFILNDVFFQQGNDYKRDQLKSKYLCFNSNFHGDLKPYLTSLWTNNESQVREIWQHCVAFEHVTKAADFVDYIKSCQVKTTLFFNGSNDESVAEQLKALYVKQMFSEFVLTQQGKSGAEIKQAFKYFLQRVQLNDINSPSWKPGQTHIQLT